MCIHAIQQLYLIIPESCALTSVDSVFQLRRVWCRQIRGESGAELRLIGFWVGLTLQRHACCHEWVGFVDSWPSLPLRAMDTGAALPAVRRTGASN